MKILTQGHHYALENFDSPALAQQANCRPEGSRSGGNPCVVTIQTKTLRELRTLRKRWCRFTSIKDGNEGRYQRVLSALSEIDAEVKRRTTPKV